VAESRPLPGQSIAIGPETDPQAGEFQRALRSMVSTPDDYYRWERDRAIAEQDRVAREKAETKKDKWKNYLDGLSPHYPVYKDDGLGSSPRAEAMAQSMGLLEERAQAEMDAYLQRIEHQKNMIERYRGDTGNYGGQDFPPFTGGQWESLANRFSMPTGPRTDTSDEEMYELMRSGAAAGADTYLSPDDKVAWENAIMGAGQR